MVASEMVLLRTCVNTPSNKSCHKTERRYNNVQPDNSDLLPRDIYTCTQKNHLTSNHCITSSSCAENCLETLYLGGGYGMHDLVRIIALHLTKTYTE